MARTVLSEYYQERLSKSNSVFERLVLLQLLTMMTW